MYQTVDGNTAIEVVLSDDTVWLTIDKMAELFQRNKSTISRHIKNIFEDGELKENYLVVANYATVYNVFKVSPYKVWMKLPKDVSVTDLEKRMKEISERYGDRFFEVEVINEVLLEKNWAKGTKSALSEQWDVVNWSFEAARKYFPDDVLVINEGNPLYSLAAEDYRAPYFMEIENALLKGAEIDKIAEYNQAKVLSAMQKNKVSAACFAATTGYGYDDINRGIKNYFSDDKSFY